MRLNFHEKLKYQESLESFKSMIKSSLPVSVSILDRNGCLIFSNDATLELLNKPLTDIDLDKEITLQETHKDRHDRENQSKTLKLMVSEAILKTKPQEIESQIFSNYAGFLTNINLEDGYPKPVDVLIGKL